MESPNRWSDNPDDGKDCHQCGQGIADSGEPILHPLSLDERIEKIQRYLPHRLTGKILSQKKIEGEMGTLWMIVAIQCLAMDLDKK